MTDHASAHVQIQDGSQSQAREFKHQLQQCWAQVSQTDHMGQLV